MLTTLFLVCAGVGAVVLVAYFALGMFGHGDTDGAHDAVGTHLTEGDGGVFFGVLSLRAIASAVTAFGLAGMAGLSAGLGVVLSLLCGFAAGLAAMALVVFLLRSLKGLAHTGTIDLARAVDQIATVYIPIPGAYAGTGKVTLDVSNRTLELAAVTQGASLPTGARVRVVQLVDTQTAEVAPIGITPPHPTPAST